MVANRGDDARRGEGTADTVAGLIAALALAVGALALVWYPGRLGPAAMLVALVAAGLSGAQRRFVGISLALITVCWFAGMVIAVVTERPIF